MNPAPLAAADTISRRHWILAVSAATGLDLAARFATTFDFGRVMHVEAVLFPLTTLCLAALLRREPRIRGWPRAVRVGLAWLFGLGALRPVLWTLGVPLMTANIATLLAAVAGLVLWAVRRGRPTASS